MLLPPAPGRRQYCYKHYQKVTHCLFDMDGTILDTEHIYHKVIGKICNKYGKPYPKEMQVKCYGVTDHEISETVVARLNIPVSVDQFERELLYLVGRSLVSSPVVAGAERLLQHLHVNNVPMALATNSSEQTVRVHMAAHPKLFSLFDHLVTVSDPDVDRGKPFPDIYLVAASRFPEKPKPNKCIVFEDSEVGVKAGISAGMQVVMIPDPKLDYSQTREATLVIRSLHHFKPEMFGLPPFAAKTPKY